MKLQAYLDAKNLSIRDFAERSGVSQATISRVARGFTASLQTAIRIEKATAGTVRVEDLPS